MEVTMATASTLENLRHSQDVPMRERLLSALLLAEAWVERHRQRRTLLELDGRMLHDLGLSNADVQAEVSKHFWEK
ncbi:MAG: DUF1127 domain-containing protein [Microvirga sp.]|jgi:uncharacterized protein YjiS (DUF1127 family)